MSSLFQNKKIVDGINEVKNCIKNIDNSLSKRHNDKAFGSLSSYTEEIKNLKSPVFSGVSLNDLYTFKNGVLIENSDISNPINYLPKKTSPSISKEMLSSYVLSTSISSRLSANIKRSDLAVGKNKNFAHNAETYFTPNTIDENDYNYIFDGTNSLSTVQITCDFIYGGLNYAFRNCKNLKTVSINVTHAHGETISKKIRANNCFSLEDIKKSSYFDSQESNSYISSLIIPAVLNGTLLRKKQWNWGCFFEPTVTTAQKYFSSFKPILYRAFEGCDNLETIILSDLYFNDIFDYSGVNAKKLNSLFEISSYFGLNPNGNTVLKLKDGAFRASDGGYISEDKRYVCNNEKIIFTLSTDIEYGSSEYHGRDNARVDSASYLDLDNNRHYINTIGKRAFAGLLRNANGIKLDTNLTVGNYILSVLDEAFADNDIWNLTLPDGLKYIGDKAFGTIWHEVRIPSSVEYIGKDAFIGKSGRFDLTNGFNHGWYYPLEIYIHMNGKTMDEVQAMENYPFGLDKYKTYKRENPRYEAPNVSIECSDGWITVCWNESTGVDEWGTGW